MEFKYKSVRELFSSIEQLEKRKTYLELVNPNANISIKSLSNGTYEMEYWVDENHKKGKGYTVRDLAEIFNDFFGFSVKLTNALNATIKSEDMATDMLVMNFNIDFVYKEINIQVLTYGGN